MREMLKSYNRTKSYFFAITNAMIREVNYMSGKLEEGGQLSRPMEYRVGSVAIIVGLVLLGVILIWAGQLVVATTDWEKTEDVRAAYKTNLILTGVGSMISSVALIGGALTNENLDKFVRLGMIIAAALIIVEMMTWGTSFLYRYW